MSDELKGGIEALMKPFSDLLDKLAGPAVEEIGLTLQDHVRMFRLKRQLRLFERVKHMLHEAGLDAGRVPLKLLQPIIENASQEEDDDLQDRWAALLANAAVSEKSVHPSFIEVLKQLSSSDVLTLDVLDRKTTEQLGSKNRIEVSADKVVAEIRQWLLEKGLERANFASVETELVQTGAAENLSRLGLATMMFMFGELELSMTCSEESLLPHAVRLRIAALLMLKRLNSCAKAASMLSQS